MNLIARFFLICWLLFITVDRLPAPIVDESPTPAREHSAKPKAKRTIKSKGSQSSEASTQRQPLSPKQQPTPRRNLIDGTWVGTLNDIQFTATISGSGTIVPETSTDGTFTWNATYDGTTMRWTWQRALLSGDSTARLIDPIGRTALVTSKSDGAPLLLGAGAHNSTAVFYKVSQ